MSIKSHRCNFLCNILALSSKITNKDKDFWSDRGKNLKEGNDSELTKS